MRKSFWLSWLALLASVLMAYCGALANGYVWDDTFFLSGNVVIEDFSHVLRIVTEPLFGQRSYFRPIPLLMIYTESLLSARDPAVSHAVNLAIHLVNCTLLLLLVRRAMADLGKSGRVAWLAPVLVTLVYAVHPATPEAVVWISSRFDLMATMCMLLALCVWGADRFSALIRALLVAVIFFLGALCKESLVALPVVLVAYQLLRDMVRSGQGAFLVMGAFTPKQLLGYAGIVVAGLVYLCLRYQALAGADLLPGREYPLQLKVLLPLLAIGQYIRLTLLPFSGISPHHSFYWSGPESLVPHLPWLTAAFVLLVVAIFGLVRRRAYGLLLAAWLFSLFPVLHVLQLTIGDNLVHERFMYFPLAVALLLSPYVVPRLPFAVSLGKVGVVAALVFVLVSIPLVRSVVPMWRNDAVLWEWVAHTDPQSREAKANLLWVYAQQNDYERAAAQYEELKKISPRTDASTAINMGAVYYNMGNYQAALEMYETALRQRSKLPPAYRSNLYASTAVVNALLGRDLDARGFIAMALAEKVVTVNAVSNYLAFCKGRENISEPSRFSETQYRRAVPVTEYVTGLLLQHQREKYDSGSFCPDAMGAPVPAT